MKVYVRAEVRPTEDISKVKQAVLNVVDIPNLKLVSYGDIRVLEGIGSGPEPLKKLYNQIRKQRILDSARHYLMRGRRENTVTFYLNKQAAYMGIVSFCSFEYGESPLGAISVTVETDKIDQFINWLTPRTVNGKPVDEEEPPDP